MPFCPKCGLEYRDGYTLCADCGCELSESLPENFAPDGTPEPAEWEELTFAGTTLEAAALESLLRSYGIEARREVRGMGELSKIYTGMSVTGERILVQKADLQAAQEILDAPGEPLSAQEIEQMENKELEDYEPTVDSQKDRERKIGLFMALAVGVPLALYVIGRFAAHVWSLFSND